MDEHERVRALLKLRMNNTQKRQTEIWLAGYNHPVIIIEKIAKKERESNGNQIV
jgi:hypothetical protein